MRIANKNYSGTSTRIANKVVPVFMYVRPESHPRCLVYLLDTYQRVHNSTCQLTGAIISFECIVGIGQLVT